MLGRALAEAWERNQSVTLKAHQVLTPQHQLFTGGAKPISIASCYTYAKIPIGRRRHVAQDLA